MKERNSPVYGGVGNPHPLFVTSSLLRLKPHCDCIDPLPPYTLKAALIVAMWDSSASSSLFVLEEVGESRELEQAVETAFPWEQVKETPKMAFLIYVGNPHRKPTGKQEDVCVPSIH